MFRVQFYVTHCGLENGFLKQKLQICIFMQLQVQNSVLELTVYHRKQTLRKLQFENDRTVCIAKNKALLLSASLDGSRATLKSDDFRPRERSTRLLSVLQSTFLFYVPQVVQIVSRHNSVRSPARDTLWQGVSRYKLDAGSQKSTIKELERVS